MQHSILLVDDEKDITDALERQFRKKYQIFKANSGLDGLKVLRKEKISVIISDQRMPNMTGVEFLEQAQRISQDPIRILLTGYTDVESVIAAINSGQIYRYVTKPWDPNDLEIAVQRGIEAYDLRAELRQKNAELSQALEELKSLDTAKSHFMILIGHELKTPLTTIESFLALLKEEEQSAEKLKYISRIEQGAGRLHEIVFDVLDLMNAEAGTYELHMGSLDLVELATKTVGEMKSLADKKNVDFVLPTQKFQTKSDAKALKKIFQKIIHNAIKYAEEKSTVHVVIDNPGDSSKFRVSVKNEGPPLSKDTIQKILKPFSLDENIMNHSQGMGLGLSLTQALLKLFDSRLEIKSAGGSTTVSFEV